MGSAAQSAPTLLEMPESPQPRSLQLWDLPTPQAFSGARCRRFEFTSRGDRVPGRLLLPGGGRGPFPLVLFQHGAGGSKEAEYMDAAGPWVAGGAAVASIDLPLHGERSSAKLSERLLASILGGAADPDPHGFDAGSRSLWVEFTRQTLCDLRVCLDAMGALPEIDAERVVYASFSLGSLLGALFCALDPRPRAAALALAGGGFGPARVDPARYIAKLAPRPLLMVNATRDELISRQAAQTLFVAAADPKTIEWFDADHHALPGRALKTLWLFIREQLELSR